MTMAAPAVHCRACEYDWHSEAMADGLRLIGSCPRCGGELEFASPASEHHEADAMLTDARPAHMVLGVPRGW
jgi:hypothetical protein